jgi:exopolyphosphatase / guanosine-5'-triphosphate,3'-diphosphate pyrophosphatase
MDVLAGFDIGSGAVKLSLAYRGEASNELEILYERQIEVLVSHQIKQSPEHLISEETFHKLLQAIVELIQDTEAISRQKITKATGIATAAFRDARNGTEIIHRLSQESKVPISIISQKMEGYLGFLTALYGAQKIHQNLSPEKIISWDTGGGSFQICACNGPQADIDNLLMAEGNYGSSVATALIIEQVQSKNFSETQTINPATMEHCERGFELLCSRARNMDNISQISSRISNAIVIGIGGATCAFKVAWQATGKYTFSKDDVWNALKNLQGKTDQELSEYLQSEMVLSKLLILCSVMEVLEIPSVTYCPSNGSINGLFLCSSLWKV